jgi:hypothetical protein
MPGMLAMVILALVQAQIGTTGARATSPMRISTSRTTANLVRFQRAPRADDDVVRQGERTAARQSCVLSGLYDTCGGGGECAQQPDDGGSRQKRRRAMPYPQDHHPLRH